MTTPAKIEYSVGETVTFSCEKDFELDGLSTAICLSSGIFSSDIPTCKGELVVRD